MDAATQAQKLPNGNLLVPKQVTLEDGTILDFVMVEIGPHDPEYRRWLDWINRRTATARVARKPGRKS